MYGTSGQDESNIVRLLQPSLFHGVKDQMDNHANKFFMLFLVLALFGCSTSTEPADAESLARLHVEANGSTMAHDIAVELAGEHWLLEELGIEWIAVRIADGVQWTYTKTEGEAGIVALASTARATIPVSHESLEREYTVTVSVPYMLAVDIEEETVEATADYLNMTIEHDIPLLPGVDGEDVGDAANAAKELLKQIGN